MILSRAATTLPPLAVDDLLACAEALGLPFFPFARTLGVSPRELRAALTNGASGPLAEALLSWEASIPRSWQLVGGRIAPAPEVRT